MAKGHESERGQVGRGWQGEKSSLSLPSLDSDQIRAVVIFTRDVIQQYSTNTDDQTTRQEMVSLSEGLNKALGKYF